PTYDSLSYGEHAKNIAIDVAGGKLLKTVGGKIFGGAGSRAAAGDAASVATSAKSAIDPLAESSPVSKGASTAGRGSRSGASGVGEVRAPISDNPYAGALPAGPGRSA